MCALRRSDVMKSVIVSRKPRGVYHPTEWGRTASELSIGSTSTRHIRCNVQQSKSTSHFSSLNLKQGRLRFNGVMSVGIMALGGPIYDVLFQRFSGGSMGMTSFTNLEASEAYGA